MTRWKITPISGGFALHLDGELIALCTHSSGLLSLYGEITGHNIPARAS